MTQGELDNLCALWQKRLRLQDWQVTVEVVRKYQLPDCFAEIIPHGRTKTAKVNPPPLQRKWLLLKTCEGSG